MCEHPPEKVSTFTFYEPVGKNTMWDWFRGRETVRFVTRWMCEDCKKELQPVWKEID